MGSKNLFLSAEEQVFSCPGRRPACLPLTLLLIIRLIVPDLSGPAAGPRPGSGSAIGQGAGHAASARAGSEALAQVALFFAAEPRGGLKGWVRRQAVLWRGDPELAALRAPYNRALTVYFFLMAVDSLLVLAVPFLGQALTDTAARGAGVTGSLAVMAGVSALLIAADTVLDPARRILHVRLAGLTSRFVADVRVFLLAHVADQPDLPADPATRAGLLYFHAPAFAVRNIDAPLKLPQILGHGLLSAWLLWRLDPIVTTIAVATASALGLWSRRWSRPLAETAAGLRQAEAAALVELKASLTTAGPQARDQAITALRKVERLEIRQAQQGQWFNGLVDRVGTLILMTGVMLWGFWHQYLTGKPSTGEILAVLALAWQVQFKISALLALVKARLEAESATFLLPVSEQTNGPKQGKTANIEDGI